MGNSMIEQAIKLFREKRKYRYWLAAFLCLAVLVTLGTVTVLKMNGQAANHKQKLLDCQIELHEHTEGCYDSEGRVICGYADYAVHTHNDDCYDSEGTLVCQLPEVQAHTHSPECYQEKEELVCGLEESEGHVHTEECYTREQGALICGQEEFYIDETGAEQEAHVHTDDCYEWTETLSCGQKEGQGGHTHTESCYETKTELVCGEQELHTHDETCYGQDGQLTCGLLELKEHVHGEECFETIELTKEEIETLNSAENPEKTEEAEKTVKTFEDETVKVTAEYGEFANIPEEAELVVKQITEESDPETYAEYEEKSQSELGGIDPNQDTLMDIGFYVDNEEIEPEDVVTVTVQFADDKDVKSDEAVTVLHFGEESTELLDESSIDDTGAITFKTDSFSAFAFLMRRSGEDAGAFSVPYDGQIHFYKSNGSEWIECGAQKRDAIGPVQIADYMNSGFNLVNVSQGGLSEVFGTSYSKKQEGVSSESAWIGYTIVGSSNIIAKKARLSPGFGFWELNNITRPGEDITGIFYLPDNTTVYDGTEFVGPGGFKADDGGSESEDPELEYNVIFNPGNGNGDSEGYRWEYGNLNRVNISISKENATADITLPSDTELGKTFTVTGNQTVMIPNQDPGDNQHPRYPYKLVGWYNIADNTYYDVKDGPVSATIDTQKTNVFYADWMAESYDLGSADGEELAADTNDFIETKIFDYNELFNVYSSDLERPKGENREKWSDSGSFKSPGAENDTLFSSFYFFDGFRDGTLGSLDGRRNWNQNDETHAKNSEELWKISDGRLLESLFDETTKESPGNTLGVHYLGTGNFLYRLGDKSDKYSENGDLIKQGSEEIPAKDYEGYYYYDSDVKSAVYNQGKERFYLKNSAAWYDNGTKKGFFPLNGGNTASAEVRSGELNYYFGMTSKISFYLPADAGTKVEGAYGNQYNGENMRFEFSGDDDVWVFVDDELVLDIGGIHGKVSGYIDFAEGTAEVQNKEKVNIQGRSISQKGTHTLRIYYLERGGFASNCKIKFNIIPKYIYEPPKAKTVSVNKVWKNTGDTESLKEPVDVALYQKAGDTEKQFGEKVTLGGNNTKGDWSHIWEGLPISVNGIECEYEVRETSKLTNFTSSSKMEGKQEYNCWWEIGSEQYKDGSLEGESIDGKEVILLNHEGTAALRVGDGGILTQKAVEKSSGVLLSEYISDDIKWSLEDCGKGTYKLKNGTGYLKINGDRPELDDKGDEFELNECLSTGFCSKSKRLVYQGGEFQVKANDANDGTSENANLRVHLYMKRPMTSKVRNYTITNTYLPNITIAKVDKEDSTVKLSGGRFTLTRQVGGSEEEAEPAVYAYYDDTKKQWVDAEDQAGLNKALEFPLNETLPLSNLPDGTYTLTEKEAPEGYELPKDSGASIPFVIDGAKITTVTPANTNAEIDGGKILLVKNQKKEIPKTKVKFVKISSSDKLPLGKAMFDLYRAAKEGEPSEEKLTFEKVEISVIKLTGTVESSDNDGSFYEGDLEEGTYYLRETKAPDGYNKLAKPVKIEIKRTGVSVYNPNQKDGKKTTITSVPEDQTGSVYTVQIPNSTGYKLPHTGGSGTYPFAIGSAVLFSTAAFLLYGYSIRQKRRQKRLRK